MGARATAARLAIAASVPLAAWGIASSVAGGDGPAPSGGFAGASECARCHAETHATWLESAHGRTLEEATGETVPAEVREGREVGHPPGATRFSAADGGFFAETLGPDGAPRRYRLTHLVGRNRIQMLVATLDDGRQQVLPSMREKTTGTWFDYTALFFAGPWGSPDEPPRVAPGDPSFWTGPVRSWDVQCSRCHVSGRQPLAPGPDGRGPRVAWRSLGLDCESCHGPAADHAAFHDGPAEGKDPILRLGSLPRQRAVEACLSCHMECEEVRPGFRPGDDVFEFTDPTLMDDPDRVDPAGRPLELVYAAVSFLASECVRRGGLTCLTCHDPHGGPNASAAKGPPRDDAQCLSCHEAMREDPRAHTRHDPAGAGGRCVNCHMPFLTVERGHGAVTDHTISVPRPSLRSDRVAKDACAWCHVGGRAAPPGAPPLSEAGIRAAHASWWPGADRAEGWLAAIADARRGAVGGGEALAAVLADPGTLRTARATAARLLARFPAVAARRVLPFADDPDTLVRRHAVATLGVVPGPEADAALKKALSDPSAPVRSKAARTALEAWGRVADDEAWRLAVLRVLEEEAACIPDEDTRWKRLGEARERVGDVAGAIAAYERALALDSTAKELRAHVAALRAR
jgi:predicted CXXCH cytochrome family protein